MEVEGDGAERGVGDGFEGGAQAAVDGVDVAVGFDVDLAVEVDGQVGEAVGRRSAGRRGLRGAGREAGVVDFGVAEERAGRAALGGELDSGADGVDVGVVEELVGGRVTGDAAGVGFAGLGGEDGVDRRVAEAVDAAGELEGELGGEGEGGAVGDLEVVREGSPRAPSVAEDCRR